MKVLDLFSGIGGFSLGLERAGMETVAFCEIDKYCHEVLRKHWPDVPIYGDVKSLDSSELGEVDIICGGFPCQDISVGGSQKGIKKGTRSGLWKEFRRLIDEIKPKYAIIENVERLRKNGLGIVLNDLSEIGYDVEWHCIRARAIGLPHQRDRIWIIAHPSELRLYEYTRKERYLSTDKKWESQEIHPERSQCELEFKQVRSVLSKGQIKRIRDAYSLQFSTIPNLCRVVDGIPKGLDEHKRKRRVRQLGNSVVPQIPELIGRAIMEYENDKL